MKCPTDKYDLMARVVTPCVGVWIEIFDDIIITSNVRVTPCVGVWIEINPRYKRNDNRHASLPAWECGLK